VFTVLDGELTEHAQPAAAPDTRPTERTLTPGRLRVFAPGYVHEMVNAALEPAVSLHIYYPGLTEMPMRPPRATGRLRPAARPAERTGVRGGAGC
jgi:predicted metal-dependent enzyme (double-stranded beta helix superfamily)